MTASEILLEMAANAEQRVRDLGTGRYLFVESRGWYLKTTVADGVASSKIAPVHRRQWKAADGSGRIISVWGAPYALPTPGEEVWRDPYDDHRREEDEEFAPGKLRLGWSPDSLSGNPEELRHQLTGQQTDLTPARVLTAVKDLYNEQPVAPTVAAAVLRIVADLPGLHHDESTSDPVRVSLEFDDGGSSTRYVMMFDKDTGLLVGSEEVLTRSAGYLAAAVPCVVSRRIYVRAARTEIPGPA